MRRSRELQPLHLIDQQPFETARSYIVAFCDVTYQTVTAHGGLLKANSVFGKDIPGL